MAIARSLRAISGAALTGALVFSPSSPAAADDVRDHQWALNYLQSAEIWDITKGQGQKVAVIDDGVFSGHVDLKGNVLEGKNFNGGSSTEPDKGDQHGTSMASIIAGHGHGEGNSSGVMGLAPKAKIIPLKDDGTSPTGFADSIRYAVQSGASVINISRGSSYASPTEEEQAVAYAFHHGVPVVAPTGNEARPVEYPAAIKGAVAVSGSEKGGNFWSKSNRGPETIVSAPAAENMAAGTKSESAYLRTNGTSDSAAYTSASLALLRAQYPDLSTGQLVNRLTKTAETASPGNTQNHPDHKYGFGVIQPLSALTKDIPKGSKLGPLSAPKFDNKGNTITGDEPSQAEIDAENAESEREAKIIWAVLGVMGVVFVGLVVLVVVLVRKKKKRQNSGPGGPSWPGGPGGPGMPGAYGPVQPQRGMPPVPPQQPGGDPAPPYQPPRS